MTKGRKDLLVRAAEVATIIGTILVAMELQSNYAERERDDLTRALMGDIEESVQTLGDTVTVLARRVSDLEQDTTEPPPPPSPVTRGRLELIELRCIETEDATGEDDPYLRVDREVIWRGGMNDDETEDLTHLRPIPFEGTVRIDLREGDWLDPNDHLGTTYARVSHIGNGVREYHFTGDGAHYVLRYRVTP